MRDDHSGYHRFRRRLALGYFALGTLLIALLAWKTISAYQTAQANALSVTAHSARAMAAHVAELIDAVDQPLQSSARAIAEIGGASLDPAKVQSLLAASSLAQDARFWLVFIDAKGRGVAASNGMRVAGVVFSDRPYFSAQAAEVHPDVFIGGPRIGAVSHRRVFFLSRRVESSAGRFLGVVAASVAASRVAAVFESARLEPTMSIVLATRDYKIIARSPLFEQSFGADLASIIAAGRVPVSVSGSFAATSPFQGDRRIYSYAPAGSYPLIVAVGVAQDSVMERIRKETTVGVLSVALVLAVGWFSGRLALSQYWRLELAESRQRTLIADLAQARDQLEAGERRIRMIADNLPAKVAYITNDERFTYHNSSASDAVTVGTVIGKTVREAFGEALYDELKGDIRKALAGERVCVEQSCVVDGEERFFRREYMPDIGPDGCVRGFYSLVTDITDLKLVQQTLSAIARVDSLTGLPNRAELLDRLDAALARCRRIGTSLACLYLDIDRFKEINDTLGHSAGDAALVEFGRRLKSVVRETDLVARLAGDEFVILLEGLDQPQAGELIAAKILDAMRSPFDIEGTLRSVTTSIGVAIARPLEDDARSLLRAGDAALYRAKREGRNCVASYGVALVGHGAPLGRA